jgi:hypothetical protein
MAERMAVIADSIRSWAEGCRFPSRLRLFTDGPSGGVLPEDRWTGVVAGARIAAAVGCALTASNAVVVTVVHPEERDDPLVGEALALAATTSAPLRCLAFGGGDPPPGWSTEAGPCWMPASAMPVDDHVHQHLDPVAPVHLTNLRRWAVGEASMESLGDEEPRLLLSHSHPHFSAGKLGPMLAIAMASAASEGMRTVLTVDGSVIGSWWSVLSLIGQRHLPLCLRVTGTPPPLGWWRSLPGWWVCDSSPMSVRGVVARALGSRDTVAVLAKNTDIPAGDPDGHEPGGGRWWHSDKEPRVLIAGPGSAVAMFADTQRTLATLGIPVAWWESTSVHPLALPHEYATLPIVAIEGDLPGYGEAVQAHHGGHVEVVTSGGTVTEIVAATRRCCSNSPSR